jgi:hypothetical protein
MVIDLLLKFSFTKWAKIYFIREATEKIWTKFSQLLPDSNRWPLCDLEPRLQPVRYVTRKLQAYACEKNVLGENGVCVK